MIKGLTITDVQSYFEREFNWWLDDKQAKAIIKFIKSLEEQKC